MLIPAISSSEMTLGRESPDFGITRNPKRETRNRYSSVSVVNSLKLGQFETDHVSCGGPDQRLVAVSISVARDDVRRHGGVLLVHLAVDDEERSRPAIQPVMFF